MPDFPHLPLREALAGNLKAKRQRRNNKLNPTTKWNLDNRAEHGANLSARANEISRFHQDVLTWRRENGFPDLPENVTSVFLKVDPQEFNIEALKGFGIEIISEEGEGFIIGATVDGFKSLRKKIKQFTERGKAVGTARLWDIIEGIGWRPREILSEELYRKWEQIQDTDELVVDISIACYLKASDHPRQEKEETDATYERKVQRWRTKHEEYLQKRDDFEFERQEDIDRFIEPYSGERISTFVSYEDSFCFRARLPGQALKDLVLNYPYVFEVIEHVEVGSDVSEGIESTLPELNLIPPPANAPKVCVIDSGVMEGHRLLAPAILNARSISLVPDEDDITADHVPNGGHGTKVAGAVLYANRIPREDDHQLPFFLLNARVLDGQNQLSNQLFPPQMMREIADHHADATIVNLSITSRVPCQTTHMSQWAASIDQLAHENSKLYIIAAGNINTENFAPNNPGIKNHLQSGRNYPGYLLEASCRVANPAQSAFALTVGSVCLDRYEDEDLVSFGDRDEISSFSRGGWGMWGAIKPEVVEYGGDWVREKQGRNLMFKDRTCPELVQTTGGVGRGSVGTSFSAPKVAHIAAHLQRMFPEQNALFYKALIIQSARLPETIVNNPTASHIRSYGYGIPSFERAVQNNAQRITFTTTGMVAPAKANLYTVKIPTELRRQGEDYDVLVEVSLCYTAKPRRTRRRIGSYLSAWLTWQSAPFHQSFEAFKADVLKNIEAPADEQTEDGSPIPWVIRENPIWGQVGEVKRQDSANQKDWAILKSYNLPEELSFAVVGHKGWEKDLQAEVPYAFVVSFEVLNGEVPLYELMARVNVEVEVEI